MKTVWTNLQLIIAVAGGWVGWFLGGTDGFLYALIALVVNTSTSLIEITSSCLL